MRRHSHSHPCRRKGCPNKVECFGEWRRNFDGWPEALCDDYHLPNGQLAEVTCEAHSLTVEDEA